MLASIILKLMKLFMSGAVSSQYHKMARKKAERFRFGVKRNEFLRLLEATFVFTLNNWRSLDFVPEWKCETTSTRRKKRASTLMDVTTSLSECLWLSLFFMSLSAGLRDLIDLSWLSFQQVNTNMRWNVFAVWMECMSSLFHTAVRGAASTYRTERPVLRPSSTVAWRSRPTAPRRKRTASYWLEVRDDRVPTRTWCFIQD